MKKVTRTNILEHLAIYKREVLGVVPNGTWWRNGRVYTHILPSKLSDQNVIDAGFKNELLQLISEKEKHLGFHHLNSSQALAVNLFGPFLTSGRLTPLSKVLGHELVKPIWKFEKVFDPDEGTNFDLFGKTEAKSLFFEVKYTEDRFGSAKDDEHHNNKYREIYLSRLESITSISRKDFFREYQLWRNLLYQDSGVVFFVIPKFREDLLERIEIAKDRTSHAERVKVVFIDDICDVGMSIDNTAFNSHYTEFRKKYLDGKFA